MRRPWKGKAEVHVWWLRLCLLHEVGGVWSSALRGDGWTWHVWELPWRQEADCSGKVIFPELMWPFFNPNCNPQNHQLICLPSLLLALVMIEGQSERYMFQRQTLSLGHSTTWDSFQQSPPTPLFSLSQYFPFFFPFHHFPGLYLQLANGKQNRICSWPWLTGFMNYFRWNLIKVNVSTVRKSLNRASSPQVRANSLQAGFGSRCRKSSSGLCF